MDPEKANVNVPEALAVVFGTVRDGNKALEAAVRYAGERRIHRRGRSMESTISEDYLNLLDSFYDEWLGAFDLCPVLTLRTDNLDYVNQPGHLDLVTQRIQDKLAGKEVMDLTHKS